MATTKRRYTDEEIAQRGDAIYERDIRPLMKKRDNDRIVAIDVETGEWALGDTVLDACDRLQKRVPEPESYCVRVGSRHVYHFGRHVMPTKRQ